MMTNNHNHDRIFLVAGLGTALLIAIFVSPFASSDPDGLDRVSQDLKFDKKASSEPPAKKIFFAEFFEEYTLKGVPEPIATPMAGLVGTLATFGLALGVGKLMIRKSSAPKDPKEELEADTLSDSEEE